jgi:myosin heavy subunit
MDLIETAAKDYPNFARTIKTNIERSPWNF